MKRLVLATFLLLNTFQVSAQCTAPELVNWNFETITQLNLAFMVTNEGSEYNARVSRLYGYNAPIIRTYSGQVNSGLNSVTFNPHEDMLILDHTPYNNYYRVDLYLSCSNITSDTTTFYVSYASLFNQTDFSCFGYFFQPFEPIEDFVPGAPFEDSWNITQCIIVDGPEIIEDMRIFVDFAHTFNPDVEITLRSPSGTEIILVHYIGNWGSPPQKGGSIIFDNNSMNNLSDLNNGSDQAASGNCAPAQSFDAFIGESANGIWEVNFIDNWDGDDGMIFGVCIEFSNTECSSEIGGKVYYDLNANLVQDIDEPPFSYAFLNNNLVELPILSNLNGTYTNCSPEGNLELSLSNPPTYYEVVPEIHYADLSNGNQFNALDFALQPISGINDLEVDCWISNLPRPGIWRKYFINYSNMGTQCVNDVSITYTLDPILEFISTNAIVYSVIGNVYSFELGTLCPNQQGTIEIFASVPPSSNFLGEIIFNTAVIEPLVNDINTTNNYSELEVTIIGSFDPNDKSVSEEHFSPEFLTEEKNLEYLIRFQNTGTSYAENVIITDLLSPLLNPNTFVLLNNSHPMDVQYENNTLHFIFNDIMLPDSTTNEPESHGYVRFKIKPYQNIALGSVIENTANIYFDFNEPIITNTTQTFYTLPTNISATAEGLNINIYPNPARDQITVVWGSFKPHWLEILDISGRVVSQNNVSQSEEQTILNIASMPAGLYFLRLSSAQTQSIARWVKQ
jgi:uncharacterized repeat protein (TIGR01451 family)